MLRATVHVLLVTLVILRGIALLPHAHLPSDLAEPADHDQRPHLHLSLGRHHHPSAASARRQTHERSHTQTGHTHHGEIQPGHEVHGHENHDHEHQGHDDDGSKSSGRSSSHGQHRQSVPGPSPAPAGAIPQSDHGGEPQGDHDADAVYLTDDSPTWHEPSRSLTATADITVEELLPVAHLPGPSLVVSGEPSGAPPRYALSTPDLVKTTRLRV